MAVTSGFFNSLNHDRRYDADQMGSIFDGIILDGVYLNIGDAFEVTAGPGDMQVTVGTGRAWFMHTWTLNDSAIVFNVTEASLASSRIDAVVIDVDKRRSIRENTIKYISGLTDKEGTGLINEEDHKQYPICYIDVTPGVTKITNSAITYKCGSAETPFVTGILEMLNLDNVTNQFNSVFYEWFDGIKDVLDDNAAADLYNKLDTLGAQVKANTSQIRRIVTEVFDPANGQNLGTTLTAAQKSAIESGTFDGIYPGDYWTINGVKWYVIDYDYYMRYTPHDGTPACTKHHVVVIPEKMFTISNHIDVKLEGIANLLNHSTDAPYVFQCIPRPSLTENWFGGTINKDYLFNTKLITDDGFDFQHPGTEAVAFAKSAWGDNLVAVPDVFGDVTTMYQDFNWETTEGIIIPHFLDMKSARYSYDGGQLHKINALHIDSSTLEYEAGGTVLPTIATAYNSWSLDQNGPEEIYQNGNILPSNGISPRPYAAIDSDCRQYLTARFIPGNGFQVDIAQLPSSFTNLFTYTITTSQNTTPHGFSFNYTKDSMDLFKAFPVTKDSDYKAGHEWNTDHPAYVLHDLSAIDQANITAGGIAVTGTGLLSVVGQSAYPSASHDLDDYYRYSRSEGGLSCYVYIPHNSVLSSSESTATAFRLAFYDSEDTFVQVKQSSGFDTTFYNGNPASIHLQTTTFGNHDRTSQDWGHTVWQYPIVCCVG